jgi:hypothetical protein
MLLALNVFTVLFTASVLRVDAVASTRHLLLGRNELPGQPSISAGAGANAGNHTAYNNPFAAITPSTSFKWVPCFQEVGAVKNVTYECARFQVSFGYAPVLWNLCPDYALPHFLLLSISQALLISEIYIPSSRFPR